SSKIRIEAAQSRWAAFCFTQSLLGDLLMPFQRACGSLLHITSLPARGGIGDLGEEAYRFIDFLSASRQRLWQVLPTSPPATGNSPYSATSAFAGNPLFISLERLAERGW